MQVKDQQNMLIRVVTWDTATSKSVAPHSRLGMISRSKMMFQSNRFLCAYLALLQWNGHPEDVL